MGEMLDPTAPSALLVALARLDAAFVAAQTPESITSPALHTLQTIWHPDHATWIPAAQLAHEIGRAHV